MNEKIEFDHPLTSEQYKCHTCGEIYWFNQKSKPEGCIEHIAPLDCAWYADKIEIDKLHKKWENGEQ